MAMASNNIKEDPEERLISCPLCNASIGGKLRLQRHLEKCNQTQAAGDHFKPFSGKRNYPSEETVVISDDETVQVDEDIVKREIVEEEEEELPSYQLPRPKKTSDDESDFESKSLPCQENISEHHLGYLSFQGKRKRKKKKTSYPQLNVTIIKHKSHLDIPHDHSAIDIQKIGSCFQNSQMLQDNGYGVPDQVYSTEFSQKDFESCDVSEQPQTIRQTKSDSHQELRYLHEVQHRPDSRQYSEGTHDLLQNDDDGCQSPNRSKEKTKNSSDTSEFPNHSQTMTDTDFCVIKDPECSKEKPLKSAFQHKDNGRPHKASNERLGVFQDPETSQGTSQSSFNGRPENSKDMSQNVADGCQDPEEIEEISHGAFDSSQDRKISKEMCRNNTSEDPKKMQQLLCKNKLHEHKFNFGVNFTSTPRKEIDIDTSATPSSASNELFPSEQERMMWNGYLNSIFNISTGLRENQEKVIKCFVTQQDVLHIVRTSGGKSICYQLPSLLEPQKLVLVISPISALIREQVVKLQQLGVKAALLGNDSDGDVNKMEEVQILYMNPECLFVTENCIPSKNMDSLKRRHENGEKEISLIAIDEAHKVFEWSSFRPAYREIMNMKEHFPTVPLHMHSATLTKRMQDSCANEIMKNPVLLRYPTNRPNIYYRVLKYSPPSLEIHPNGKRNENWSKTASAIICESNDKPALVYLSFAKSASDLTTSLLQRGKKAGLYQGRSHQTVSDRESVQDSHLNGEIQYMIATSAYGVGIENPRENLVFTVGTPATCIEWIQQAGRVGRSGQNSIATLFVSPYNDSQKLNFWEKHCKNSKEKKQLKEEYAKMLQLTYLPYAGLCQRAFMMKELEDASSVEFTHPLGCCDGCNLLKYFAEIQKSASINILLNTLIACDEIEKLGIFSITENKITAYLKGKCDKVANGDTIIIERLANSNDLKAFGIAKEGVSVKVLSITFKQCVAKGWLTSDFFTFRFKSKNGDRPAVVHRVLLSDIGRNVILSKNVDLPDATHVEQAIMHVREKEENFIGSTEGNKENTKLRSQTRAYKQPQPIVEKMLKGDIEPIISRDQFIYLGFNHDYNKLLYTDNVRNAPGYPGDDDDFIWKDVTLSKKSGIATVFKEVAVNQDVSMALLHLEFRKNPCAGVKKCTSCDFTCSRKNHVNSCPRHGETAELVHIDNCPGFFVYIKPTDIEDMRRWMGFVNGPHNHGCPPISKPTCLLETQVKKAMARDPSLQTSDLQKGYGLDCMPMAISLAAANPVTMSNLRKKCLRGSNLEETTSSSMIAHFDAYVKKEIDDADEVHLDSELKLKILEYTTPYHRELIQNERLQAGIFISPLMMRVMSESDFFECDVTFPGLPYFKYLLNMSAFNSSSLRHDVVARVLMSSAAADCYKDVFKTTFDIVTDNYPAFNKGNGIKGITLDFSLAQVKGLDGVLNDGEGVLKGCRAVHFMRQVDRVILKICKTEIEKCLFKKICVEIRENPSKEVVQKLFGCLEASIQLNEIKGESMKASFSESDFSLDLHHWKNAHHWVKWWSKERILVMLTTAYKTMDNEHWSVASNHTNHVESLNRVSVANKARITLKTQLKHMYSEDRKRAYQHIADSMGCHREKQKPTKHVRMSNKTTNLIGRYVMSCKTSNTTKRRKVAKRKSAAVWKLARVEACDEDTEICKAVYENGGQSFHFPIDVAQDTDVMLMPEDYVPGMNSSFFKSSVEQ